MAWPTMIPVIMMIPFLVNEDGFEERANTACGLGCVSKIIFCQQ